MGTLRHNDIETLPNRIVGMQRLETLFNQKGYLICQSSGERIYDFNEVVAVFLPLNPSTDNVIAVSSICALEFVQKCISSI
ncbi:hypothetical protein [Desulfosporosinus nitroreducens]|uniref:IclR-ED domain-containing protein n=1 Tax=Desulfosporosinus nitroreducens TaxID=2018668 RepID=A0ABT8QJW0_9FIRM|nr:hypothetical protein [Desulfosporosinus nitroreducens]MCO1600322.1 hypothetical protein [Desulfosporosinus nitroreducens]MDO0821410.1 hypothetical protein [Desulfosporosinus nitroreducens]